MESAGRPVTPSNPLLVERADAPLGAEVEISTDGTNWRTIGSQVGANITAFGTGWSATAGSGHTPRVRRHGNMVYLFGSVSMGTGASMNDILAVPTGFTPSNANTTFIGVTSLNPNGGTAGTRELAIASGRILAPAGYGAGSPAVGGTIPLGGCFWTVD
ncbi:hypothetical protein [Cellulosimicrobium cellulans]|nr:hypothetical protein [Cellulosimicrobium cellulans]